MGILPMSDHGLEARATRERHPFMESVLKNLHGLRESLRKWSSRAVLSILDQGLISTSNFAITILLARWVTPRQYGAYAVAFEVFLAISAVYSSLMLEPVSVFGPSLFSGNLTRYMGGLLRIHALLSLAMMVMMFGGAAAVYAVKPDSLLPNVLIAVSVAAPCQMLFWLVRRGFYVVLEPRRAVMGGALYSVLLVVGVAALYKTKTLSAVTAFLLLAAGALIASPVMLRWLKRGLVEKDRGPSVREIVRQHWRYGRWALANALVTWLSIGMYYPLIASMFTLSEAGKFKALMNLSSPIGQAFVAVSLLSLPLASRAHHRDANAVSRHLVWRLTLAYTGGTALYWVVLLAVRSPLVHHLYGGRYLDIIALLPWVAVGSVLRLSASSQTLALKAMRAPEKAFISYCAGTGAALLMVVPCMHWFGLRGAIFAWVSSGAAALVAGVLTVRHVASQRKPARRAPTEALVVREEATLSAP